MNWLVVQDLVETLARVSVERILNALPEGVLIAGVAWILLRVVRRQNSGTRFAVWFLALLAVASLPVLGGFGEGRKLSVAGMSSGTWGSMRPAINIPAHWALFVFIAWALGAGLAMARLALGLWRLRCLHRSCTAIVVADLDPAVRNTVDAITASGALTKSVTIATSECVRVPAAIGFWKRMIVLPTWALQELPPDDLNAILLHEFAHLQRWDDWTNLLQKMVRALFFFHPAVWWIENRLSVEREMACDDAVLAQTANPHGYATCLVSLLEMSLAHRHSYRPLEKRWLLVQRAVHRVREASLRLAQILDTNRPVATRIWRPALGIAGVFFAICLIALPHAPQFVGFDQGMQVGNSDHAYTRAVSQPMLQSSSQTSAVIPATWQTSEPSSMRMRRDKMAAPKMTDAKVTAKVNNDRVHPRPQLAPVQTVATRGKAASSTQEQAVVMSASADQETIPGFQTLVFIETTQYETADSAMWRVQVWRVTLVSTVRERLVRVPVVNSI